MWFPFLSPPDRWNVWIVNFEFRLRPLLMFVQLRTISVGMHHFVLYLHFNCKFWIGISVIFLSISLQISDHHNHYYYQIIIITFTFYEGAFSQAPLFQEWPLSVKSPWSTFWKLKGDGISISKITLINILKMVKCGSDKYQCQ